MTKLSDEQITTLCQCPRKDAAAPPDVSASVVVHLFGDQTAMLRSTKRDYNFQDTLDIKDSGAMGFMHVEDHFAKGNMLGSIADDILKEAQKHPNNRFPDDHMCLVFWSGSDFSWDSRTTEPMLLQKFFDGCWATARLAR